MIFVFFLLFLLGQINLKEKKCLIRFRLNLFLFNEEYNFFKAVKSSKLSEYSLSVLHLGILALTPADDVTVHVQ